MINSLTSDSAAEDLTDHPGKPWLELDFQEPGVHLTHQGLEMTSAWSFPIGSTLKVGISCPRPEAAAPTPSAALADPATKRRSRVHATGVVISCQPSKEAEGNYQLTIYFLDHLANLMNQEAENAGEILVDEPAVGQWFSPSGGGPTVTQGPGAECFGLENKATPPFGVGGVLPFFMGA